MSENSRDAVADFFEDFERVCELANEEAGTTDAEKLSILSKCVNQHWGVEYRRELTKAKH